MGILDNVKELKPYFSVFRQLNEDGFAKTRTGYLIYFLSNYECEAYLVTFDARVFLRIKHRNPVLDIEDLQDGMVPKNFQEQLRIPDKVLDVVKEIDFDLAVALGLLC